MTTAVIDERDIGPPPLRRAVVGLVLGLVTGAVAAVLLPHDREYAPSAHIGVETRVPRPPR